MHQHLMSFHWDSDIGVFLFPGLKISGAAAVIGLCFVLLVVSLVYEAIKVFQTSAKARTARERMRSASSSATETTNLLTSDRRTSQGNGVDSKKVIRMLSQAVIFLFQNIVGYLLMLSVMVYNVYVFLAVILGMGIGYFLFGHISMRINMENIRARTTNALCAERNPLEGSASTSRDIAVNDAEFRGNAGCSTSLDPPANYESIPHIQPEVEVHPCVGAHDTENLHTCRL